MVTEKEKSNINDFFDPKTFTIAYITVKWKKPFLKNSTQFAHMVNRNGGSLREDECINNGWDTYESE